MDIKAISVVTRYRALPEQTGIDLFLTDGTVLPLACSSAQLRRTLAETHCNVLLLHSQDEGWRRVVLIAGWPSPQRSVRLLVHEIKEDESVVVHSRVQLDGLPNPALGGLASVKIDTPWVQIRGKVADCVHPLSISLPADADRAVALAGDVKLPHGCELLTPADQVLCSVNPVPAPRAQVV